MEIQLERQVWALVRHGDARPRLTYAFTYFRWTASREEAHIVIELARQIAADGNRRAEAALNGPVTDQRTSFTRRFRAVRVQHASTWPNLSRPRGIGPNLRGSSGASKRILSEETIPNSNFKKAKLSTWIAEPGSENILKTATIRFYPPEGVLCQGLSRVSEGHKVDGH